jgi:type II secretion system protein C
MEHITRKQYWLLSGALILFTAPFAASAMNLLPDFSLGGFISNRAHRDTMETPSIVIERERIVIPAPGLQVPTPPPAPAADTEAPYGGIRMVGEHAYEVPGTDVRMAMTYPDTLAGQARMVPAFREGKAQGFKLFSIRPGSLPAKLGLQNGDVLKRINGISLESPERALEAYVGLREARRVELDVERDGAPVLLTYDIR